MHAAIEFAAFWAFALVTLGLAVILLNLFGNLLENDLELLPPGREALLAAFASLIEAAGVWLIVEFIPVLYRALALRAMILPILLVALIYKLMHLESWGVFEAGLLLAFQVTVGFIIASLMFGHYQAAITFIAVFGIILALIANILRNL